MRGGKGKGKGLPPGYRSPNYPMPDYGRGPSQRAIWLGVIIVVCLIAAAVAWWSP